MFEDQVAEALGKEIVAVHAANELDESEESSELLAREAAKPILAEYNEEPTHVIEMADGYAVASPVHAIFMGSDGGFDLVDVPAPAEGDPAPDDLAGGDGAAEGEEDEPGDPVPDEIDLDALGTALWDTLRESDIRTTTEHLDILRMFDEAKAAGNIEAAVGAVALFEQKLRIKVPRLKKPQKPQDVGPGAKPGSASTSRLAASEGEPDGSDVPHVKITFPESRIQEFLEIAKKVEAPEDAEVTKGDGTYTVVLPEEAAKPIMLFLKGADVTMEAVEADDGAQE